LIVVDRLNPVVNFLDSSEGILEPSSILHCYQCRPDNNFLRSPRISVVIEGVRVPIIFDTGAEISILSSEFIAGLFPDDLSSNTQAVSNMGGGLVSVFGPIELTVEVCGLVLKHPFFYYDNPVLLMAIDLFTRAALMIDCTSRCVWSKRTLRCHKRQDLADVTVKPSLHVHADKTLDMVPSSPVLSPDVETRESSDDHVDETALTQLSMALERPLLETSLVTGTSARLSPSTAIDVGIQCDESSVVVMLDDPVVSTDHSCSSNTGMLSSGNITCLVQSTLNPQASSFLTTLEPSSASLVRSRNQRLSSSAVACYDDWKSSPTEPSRVVHPMTLSALVEDYDDDITLLKSRFDPGGPEFPVQVRKPDVECTVSIPTVESLSENATHDTFQQVDFPIEDDPLWKAAQKFIPSFTPSDCEMTTEDVLLAQSLALSAARLEADGFQLHELAYDPDKDSDVELLPDLEMQALFD